MKMSNGIRLETKSLYNWLMVVALYSFTFNIKYYSYSLHFLSFLFVGNRKRNSTLKYPWSAWQN